MVEMTTVTKAKTRARVFRTDPLGALSEWKGAMAIGRHADFAIQTLLRATTTTAARHGGKREKDELLQMKEEAAEEQMDWGESG
jgi:20S proteasome alpha/beta subunit